ncbi:MAG: peptidoglycan editing factor PgeF [Anaerolineae bacterium]|nr:peptidoglycan editing factor PgeF [Anaerolineae bacterium]
MQAIERDGLRYYQTAAWAADWATVKHGIFTRHGGVSAAPWGSLNVGGTVGDAVAAVRQNHLKMYAALGVNPAAAVTTWQVHSADVVLAITPLHGRRWLAQADGLITDKPGLVLAMRYADCTPLLFYDPVRRAAGLAHAGWRGTVQGMAARMVQALQQAYGCRPADLQVIIGPSISQACFQVGEEVVQALAGYFGTVDGLVRRDPADGTAYADLWAANRLDLERCGVTQIEIAGLCTMQRTDEFFSHRGEKGRTGRFGAVMAL